MNQYIKWISASLLGFTLFSSETEHIKVQPDFEVEHLYSPAKAGQGSWVSLVFDPKGRLLGSDQFGGLYRMTLQEGKDHHVEKITLPLDTLGIGAAQGMVFYKNDLYLLINYNGKNQHKSGLYKLQDADGDDEFETLTCLKPLKGEGEHGPHSLVVDPSGKYLYLIAGNFTDLPEMDRYLLPNTWKHDNLFPLLKDPRGHATDRKEPGGWIARVELDTQRWELVAAGFRNAFDMAFNEAGDLFAYDSDMEWDFGLPWYRSTRLCHVLMGSEFGWRTGSGKWPAWNSDQVKPLLHMGQGSPTNLISLKDAKFPEEYQNSLLAFDWSFGIIYSVHLKQSGADYTAEKKEFLSGVPLPLTDGVIGPDGHLYFVTGGRRLQSDLYRVKYKGTPKKPKTLPTHALRQQLEGLITADSPENVDLIWANVGSADPAIAYTARIALEQQAPRHWLQKLEKETEISTLLPALMAQVRGANLSNKASFEKHMLSLPYQKLNHEQRMEYLRIWEIYLSRYTVTNPRILALLSPLFPSKKEEEDRLLAKLLVKLQDPTVLKKILPYLDKEEEKKDVSEAEALILRNPNYGMDIARMLEKMPPERQTYYAILLSELKTGWTPALEDRYFRWYKRAFQYRGGQSYVGFIDKARQNALSRVSRKTYLHRLSGGEDLLPSGNDFVTAPKGPGKSWKTDEAAALFKDGLGQRDFKAGQNLYRATLCDKCHSLNGEGGNVGPELSRLGTRFDIRGILEAIIDPNAAISDQYASIQLQLRNGETRVGKILSEDAQYIQLSQNPFTPNITMKIPKKDVVSRHFSTVSMMLPGLINALNEDEIKDLVAFLLAGGDPEHTVYKP
jgi:putative heme-binding domain-containing protein